MKFLLIAAALVCATAAHAERFSTINGGGLLKICTAKDATDCTAYIEGVSDTVSFYQKLQPSNGSKGTLPTYICVPEVLKGPQLRETVVLYAKRHPDLLDRQASGIVLRALQENYACKASGLGEGKAGKVDK